MQIDAEKLKELIGKQEGPTLEFKLKYLLTGQGKSTVQDEVAKDLTALANTVGRNPNDYGFLILGAGNELKPDKTRDKEDVRPFQFSRKNFLDIVNSACTPRLPNVEYEEIEVDGNYYGIITIPPSPYVHTLSRDLNTPKLWRKGSVLIRVGDEVCVASPVEIQMMEQQKKQLFNSSFQVASTTDKFIEWSEEYRLKRIDKILKGEVSANLIDGPKVVLHIIPLKAFEAKYRINFTEFNRTRFGLPILGEICEYRVNFDGMLGHGKRRYSNTTKSEFSLQILNNGIFEAVYLHYANPDNKGINPDYESDMIKELKIFLSLQEKLAISPPIFITLSLLGVQGYVMDYTPSWFREIRTPTPPPKGQKYGFIETGKRRETPIDMDNLLVPGIVIDSIECDLSKEMKEIFDCIWAACGWEQSMNYNEKTGEWIKFDDR